MADIPKPPLNKVQASTIDYAALLQQVRKGPEEPYAVYRFGPMGLGGKRFWDNHQGEGVYGKPVSVSGGVTTHLPDPDFISTNP